MFRSTRWLVLSLALLAAGCGGGGGGGGTGGGGNGGGGGAGDVTRTYRVANFGGAQVGTAVLTYGPASSVGDAVQATVTGQNKAQVRTTEPSAPATGVAAAEPVGRDMPPAVQAVENAARERALERARAAGAELETFRPRFDDATIPEGGEMSFYIATTGQNVTARKMHADADTVGTYVFAEVVGGTPVVTKATALTLDARFSTANPFDPATMAIGPRVRGLFGHEWQTGGGRDGESKIVMVLLSSAGIGGSGLYGFFRPNDEFSKAQVANSNEGEILYMNANYFTGDMYDGLATLAHEFQHMCDFNQKYVREGAFNGTEEDDTINEGQSVLAEELSGFSLTSTGGGNSFTFNASRAYLLAPQSFPFFTFGNANGDYGKGYLFMKYLYDRFGAGTLTAIATSPNGGRANIANVTGQSFESLFQAWALANLLDPTAGAPAQYTYADLDLDFTYSIRGLGNVTLPSANPTRTFNPPTSTANLTMDPWTATFVRFAGGDGSTLEATVGVPQATSTNFVHEAPARYTFSSIE